MLHSVASGTVLVLERRVLLLAWDDEGKSNDKKERGRAKVKSRNSNKGEDGDEYNFQEDAAHPGGPLMVVDVVERWRMEKEEEVGEKEANRLDTGIVQ